MMEAEIFSLEDGNGLPEAASRRPASSGATQGRVGHDFAVAKTMLNRISRSFDAIEEEAIIGRAVLRFWPPKKISLIK